MTQKKTNKTYKLRQIAGNDEKPKKRKISSTTQTIAQQTESQTEIAKYETQHQNVQSQTEMVVETNERKEYCVSRGDPSKQQTKETNPNEALPTMTSYTRKLEASHKIFVAKVGTVGQGT